MANEKDKPNGNGVVAQPRTTTVHGSGVTPRNTPVGTSRTPTPPPATERVKRAQSATSRDAIGLLARAERLQSQPGIPETLGDEITGQYEGDELAEARARRDPDERFRILETKHDKLDFKVEKLDARVENLDEKVENNTAKLEAVDAKVDRVEVAVAVVSTKMDLLPKMFENLQNELVARREDQHVVLKQTLDINAHDAKARIDGAKIATESKWKIATAVVSGLFSAGVLGAVIAILAQRC